MIATRKATSQIHDWVIDQGIDLFTRPLANAEPESEPTSVIQDPLQVLLFETSAQQRQRLGMTADLTGTRAEKIQHLQADEKTEPQAQKEYEREYGRLANFVNRMCEVIDPSPHFKGNTGPRGATGQADRASKRKRPTSKMTNAQRTKIRDSSDHPQRRITPQEEERNLARLQQVANKIVAASVIDVPIDEWQGDLATDETILITLPARSGHGTRPELLVSADPDAEYWAGKRSRGGAEQSGNTGLAGRETPDEDERGHGYGITYVIRMGRPYRRAVPNVAVGIDVGKPTGGVASAVETALRHADRHGLTLNKRGRVMAADMGFSTKNDWLPMLQGQKYATLQDYPANWGKEKPIADTDAYGNKVTGAVLLAGRVLCPAATGLEPLQPWDERKGPEPIESVVARHRRTRLIEALSMPVKTPLRKDKSGTRGRPKDGQDVETYALTVQCPAALGMVNCANALLCSGQRLADKPDVENPPSPDDPDGRPRACLQNHVTLHLDQGEAKRWQGYIHGSHVWQDYYSTMRSANERFHSSLKNPNGAGVRSHEWLQIRGRGKITLALAIATAVNNQNILEAFNRKHIGADGKPVFPPREQARRKRQEIITELVA